MDLDALTPDQRFVRAYARWRCGGKLPLYKGAPANQTGRGKLDPVYVEETEGRDVKAFWDRYSSCGDLAQGVAWHLGVRLPYVNRATMPGKWLSGRNLLHFYDGTKGVGLGPGSARLYPALHEYVKAHGAPAVKTPRDYVPSCGDLGFIWTPGQNNAHTFVFGVQLDADHVETFNYGAGGMTRTEFPGAACRESKLERRADGLWLGTRKLQYHVPLARLLADSAALPSMTGEEIDELEARVP